MELIVQAIFVGSLSVAAHHSWKRMAESRASSDPFTFFQYGFLLIFFGILIAGQL